MEQMSDLFPLPADEGEPLKPHHCAKCGTGYAGPECGRINGVGPGSRFTAGDGSAADQEAYDLKIGPYDPALDMQAWQEPAIESLLRDVIGEDPTREGLLETPKRVVKAWKHWTAGYHQDPADVLKTFEDGAEGTTGQWVIVKDIPIYSHCEHHLAPFFGTATIGYMPVGRVVGLSKLSRLADVFAKRLQVQERLTRQIAGALMEHIEPLAAMTIINCRHMCMESRGVARSGASTITQCYEYRGEDGNRDYWRDQFYQQLKAI
jgi:GTP cyclohydrolase IA